MKQHLNKKIKSEIAFMTLALFSISGLMLIQNSVKTVQNIAYATEMTTTKQCSDSDNGLDYFTKGKIIDTGHPGTFSNYDQCSDTVEGQLVEYKCINDAWYAANYQCPNGCKDGACIKTEEEVTTKCTDSDNGVDYFKKGTVIFDLFGSGNTDFKKTDECSTTVTGQLTEYKCVDDVWRGVNYQCPNGCKDGACIKTEENPVAKCEDSDNGLDYFKKGKIYNQTVSNGIFQSYDKCSDTVAGQLVEYKCLNNAWYAVNYQCPNGCNDGACIKEAALSSYSLPDNTIIKLPGDYRFYALQGGKKIAISNIADLTKYGYSVTEIQKVIKEYSSSLPSIDPNNKPQIIKDNTGKVYRIINGKKVWVPTVSAFNAQGLKWEEVSSQIDNLASYAESKLVKDSEGNIYFITNNGKKKLIINTEVFNSYGNKTEDIVEVSDEFLDSLETVKLVRENGSNRVYLLTGQTKQWIKNIQAFKRLGLKWEDIDTVNSTEISAYPEGIAIE